MVYFINLVNIEHMRKFVTKADRPAASERCADLLVRTGSTGDSTMLIVKVKVLI